MTEQANIAGQDPAPVTSQEPATGEADKTLSVEEANALAGRMLREKREANAEAAKLRKELDAFRLKEDEKKRADMSEVERAKAEAAELRAAVDREKAERARVENESAVKDHGVEPKYAGFVAAQYATAKAQEGFDPSTWLGDFKKDNPAFFGQARQPAAQGGEGVPSRTGRGDDRSRLQARISTLEAIPRRSADEQSELFRLGQALKRLAD